MTHPRFLFDPDYIVPGPVVPDEEQAEPRTPEVPRIPDKPRAPTRDRAPKDRRPPS